MAVHDDVADYLDRLPPGRRADAETLIRLMGRATGQPAVPEGFAIGFGRYHYRYASGREGAAAAAGFAMRKGAIVLYFMDGTGPYRERLERLGPHRAAVGCIYLKSLSGIDLDVLESMVAESYRTLTGGVYRYRARDSRDGRPE